MTAVTSQCACGVLLSLARDTQIACSALTLVVECSLASVPNDNGSSAANDDSPAEEPTPLAAHRAATPPQSDPVLAPLPQTTFGGGSVGIPKGSRRFIGSVRNESANIIRGAWHRYKCRSCLRKIFQHAAAAKLQALYRGFCDRRAHRDDIQQRRNAWVMARYAHHRTVSFHRVPARHRPFIAARRIQSIWKEHASHRRVAMQKRWRAAQRIQRFYRRLLFVRFMSTATERRVLHDKRTLAAIKIQALIRGVLARRVRKNGGWEQRSAEAAARLAPLQRERRRRIVEEVEADIRRQSAKDHAVKTQQELLDRILRAKQPNREIVMWSAESAIAEPLDLTSAVSTKGRPLTMVPMASGAAGFVSQAQVLKPCSTSIYLEEQAVAKEPNRIKAAKAQAALVAAAAVTSRKASLGAHPEESPTTRYVLQACEGMVT